jgi:hypothetical protein
MKWALTLLAVSFFALVGWALVPMLMLTLLVIASVWYGWKRWRAGAADRELRRNGRAWAKQRARRKLPWIEPSRPWSRGSERTDESERRRAGLEAQHRPAGPEVS